MMMLCDSRSQEEVEENVRRYTAFVMRKATKDIAQDEDLSPKVMGHVRFYLLCVLPHPILLDPPYTLESICYQVWRQMKAHQCPR